MALTYPLVSISSRLQVQKNNDSKDAYKVYLPSPYFFFTCKSLIHLFVRTLWMPLLKFWPKKVPRDCIRK